MAILKVARLGHPVLRRPARAPTTDELKGRALQRLIDDMVETMVDEDGIGLAAPQVHHSYRLLVLGDPEGDQDEPDAIPLTVLANPRIAACANDREWAWEGCLSLPGLRGLVPRSGHVLVEATDRRGKPVRLEARGYLARVLQHEMDHLDGVVFVDRMPDLRRLAFNEEFARYCAPAAQDSGAAAQPGPSPCPGPAAAAAGSAG